MNLSSRWGEIKKSMQPTIKEWKFILSRIKKSPLSLVGLALIVFYVSLAFLSPVLAPPPPGATDPFMVPQDWVLLKRPTLDTAAPIPPSTTHIFGTTERQYDLYYGCIWGSITAFRTGVYVTAFILLLGLAFGLIAAYYGGIVDEILMRFTDIVIAFPGLILAMALVVAIPNTFSLNLSLLISIALALFAVTVLLTQVRAKVKALLLAVSIIVIYSLLSLFQFEFITQINNLDKVLIALILVGWPGYTRVIRGEVLRIKNEDYVEAAKAVGCSDFRIILRHIVPNAIYPVIIMASLDIGSIVLSAAALSFLGIGAPEGYADWGWLINISRGWIGQAGLFTYLHAFIIPGLFIFTFVLGWNLLGDAFRDILDPTLRRR